MDLGNLLDEINFLENRLKVIYSFLNNIKDKEKIVNLKIDFNNNTDFNVDSITDILIFYKYDTYSDNDLSKEIDKILFAINEIKSKIL